MCGEEVLLLGGAVPAYEMFMKQWKKLSDMPQAPHLQAFISSGLERAEHYYDRFGRSKAYLFSMCKCIYFALFWIILTTNRI